LRRLRRRRRRSGRSGRRQNSSCAVMLFTPGRSGGDVFEISMSVISWMKMSRTVAVTVVAASPCSAYRSVVDELQGRILKVYNRLHYFQFVSELLSAMSI
jgi:hypothetical protein